MPIDVVVKIVDEISEPIFNSWSTILLQMQRKGSPAKSTGHISPPTWHWQTIRANLTTS
jgi:hypothetical protein